MSEPQRTGDVPQPLRLTPRLLLEALASLRLTVILLLLSMLLIFAGTWAQLEKGIWTVLEDYFRCWIAHVDYLGPVFLPGGYLVGGAMLINLIAAHYVRFKLSWRRSGVILIHAGLILLLVGELITDQLAIETNMEIDEGQTVDFAADSREVELAIVDPSPQDRDAVVAIPESRLDPGAELGHDYLPFGVRVERFFANATLYRGTPMTPRGGAEPLPTVTDGDGVGVFAVEEPPNPGTGNGIDVAAAYVTLTRDGQDLGTWLVSPYIGRPQAVQVDGSVYTLELRFRRYYKPYQPHPARLRPRPLHRHRGRQELQQPGPPGRPRARRRPRGLDLHEQPAALPRRDLLPVGVQERRPDHRAAGRPQPRAGRCPTSPA